jgi:hypothetical protein
MARELGMNPKKLGKLANHKQESWKLPLPQFIEHLYQKRFGKCRTDGVVRIEERARQIAAKKAVRREARRKMEAQVSGIAWYSREQWDKLREISVDRGTLGYTYDDWLSKAENTQARTGAAGANAEKVVVDVDELETWCHSRGWVINEKSRLRFVAHLVRRKNQEPEKDIRIEGGTDSEDPGLVPF